MRLPRSGILACLLAGLVAVDCRRAPAAASGAIVETLGKGGSAEKAALKAAFQISGDGN